MLGFLIPQDAFQGRYYYDRLQELHPALYSFVDFFGLQHIYSSYWFLCLVLLIAGSLTLAVYEQFARLLGAGRNKRLIPRKGYELCSSVAAPIGQQDYLEKKIIETIKSRHYRMTAKEQQGNNLYLVSIKHRLQRFGSPLFHAGLLLVVCAALYGLAFYGRGFVQVMQGEEIASHSDSWLITRTGFFSSPIDPDFSMRLDRLSVEAWPDEKRKRVESLLTVTPEGENPRQQAVTISAPVKYRGMHLFQSLDFGMALTFKLKTPAHPGIVSHFLLDDSGSVNKALIGSSDYPMTGYVFDLEYLPFIKGGASARPEVKVTVKKEGIQQFQGIIPLYGSVAFDDNLLYFIDIRHWSGILAVKGYALHLLYCGFALVLLGLFLLYCLNRRKVFWKVEKLAEGKYAVYLAGEADTALPFFHTEILSLFKELHVSLGDSTMKDAALFTAVKVSAE